MYECRCSTDVDESTRRRIYHMSTHAGTALSLAFAERPRLGGDLLGEVDLHDNLDGIGIHHGALAHRGSRE